MNNIPKLNVTRLCALGLIPAYAHEGDAGLDLRSTQLLTINPGERALVGTGVAVAISEGYAGFIQPRSGLANKKGLTVLNAPGLIDSGYRGELKVILINHGDEPVTITPTERIAQLVIQPVPKVTVVEVDSLDDTERGTDGFGSTGRL